MQKLGDRVKELIQLSALFSFARPNFVLQNILMDSRVTLNVDENFLQMLESSFKQNEKVHLLLDENGMARTEGFITAIDKNSTAASIELDSQKKIELKTIVAVNGVFRPEYGEC